MNDTRSLIHTSSSLPLNKHFFKYYKTITIDHNQVKGTGVHKNFPVLISIFDSDLHDDVQSNGNDIAFTNDTAWLDHEIELFDQTYNSTHAKLVVWVRIPTLSVSINTIIRMYYSNSTMDSRQNPEGVWDGNYCAVYHMNQNPSSSSVLDSTANSYDLTAGPGFNSGDLMDGVIGKAIKFDSTDYPSSEYLEMTSGFSNPTSALSLEMWFRPQLYSVFQRYFTATGARPDIRLEWDNRIMGRVNNHLGDTTEIALSFDEWKDQFYHLVITWEGGSVGRKRAYLNGTLSVDEFDVEALGNSSLWTGYTIGTDLDYTDVVNALIEEFRITSSVRTPGWFETEYNNQYDPRSFYSIGKEKKVVVYPLNAHYFRYYKKLRINHSMVSGLNDLHNFTLLISIMDEDLHDDVQSNGNDIAFSHGLSWLDHEIELFNQTYNETHAKLIAWIRIPSLSPSIDTNITMYFGNSTIGPQQNPNGVWITDYKAVWHLTEEQSGVGSNNLYEDSTLNSNHGDDYILATGKEGQIDGGQEFNGEDDYIDVSDIGSFTNLTISAWIKPKGWGQGDEDYIHQIIGDEDLNNAKATFSFRIGSQGLESYKQRLGLGINISSTWSDFESQSNLSLNTWQYVAITFDGNDIKFYIDGNNDKTQSNSGSISNVGNEWVIGYIKQPYFRDFDGFIDELRIANTPFTADWIATEYNNQYDPKSFFSIDPKEKLDTKAPTYSNLIESSNPLELGETEVLSIDVSDPSGMDQFPSGINQVEIEFEGSNHSMTNIGGDTWQYDSWTPISVGNYLYTIWMEDNSNNWNSTMGTINVTDTTPPTYSDLLESADPLQLGQNETISIKVYDSPGSGVNQVLLEYDSLNHTMSFVSGNTWSWSKWKPTLGSHPYKIYLEDMENNWNMTSGTINVVDYTGPIIENVTNSEDVIELGNNITISADAIDNQTSISTVLIELDNTNHTMSYVEGNTYEYTWRRISVGTVIYIIYVNDTVGNWNSETGSFDIVDRTAPMIGNLTESEDNLELGDIEIISIDCTDLAGINEVNLEIEGSNHSMINIGGNKWQYNWTPSSLGINLYTIWAGDNNNNLAFINDSIIVQDTTLPTYSNLVETADPLELGDNLIISIDIYDVADINQVFIEIEGVNYSMTNDYGNTWEYDLWTPNNWIFYQYRIHMEDLSGNWNSVISNITVQDTTPPPLPILTNSPSGDVSGILVFDWSDGIDPSGILYYILIIDNETNPSATPGYVYIFNITNTGPNSSYCELPEILPPGKYYYFLTQVDGVGQQGDYTLGSFTVISVPGNNSFLIMVMILAIAITSLTALVLVRRKLKKHITPPREKIPLKSIISHMSKLSSVELKVKADDVQNITDEKDIEIQINEIKSLGEGLFAEGAYLEAQKQFKIGRDLLLSLGREEESHLFSELISGIEGLIEERERRLEILEEIRFKGNSEQFFDLYQEIIDISNKLRDPDAVSYYQAELIQYFQNNISLLEDLEIYRMELNHKAVLSFNNNIFEIAAQLYEKCEKISQLLVQLGRDEDIPKIEEFRHKKNECLKRIS